MNFESIKKKHKDIERKGKEFFEYAERGINFSTKKLSKGLEKPKKVKKSFKGEGLQL